MGDRSWMHDNNDPMPVSRIERLLSGSAVGNTRTFRLVVLVIVLVGIALVVLAAA